MNPFPKVFGMPKPPQHVIDEFIRNAYAAAAGRPARRAGAAPRAAVPSDPPPAAVPAARPEPVPEPVLDDSGEGLARLVCADAGEPFHSTHDNPPVKHEQPVLDETQGLADLINAAANS